MSDDTTATTAATTTTTTTAPSLPAQVSTTDATESAIVSALNGLIAYVGTLPTSEAAPLTSEQTAALSRVTSFFG